MTSFGAEHYSASERQERRLANATEGQDQVIHRLSAELYGDLRRQFEANRTK